MILPRWYGAARRPPPDEIAVFSLPRPARPDQCEFRGAIGPKLGWLRKSARADGLSQELACQPQRVALAACLFQIDKLYVAARPAVVADEPLGLVAGKVRFGIAIIMQRVGPALDPDRPRQVDPFAPFQHQHRVPLRRIGFGLPISDAVAEAAFLEEQRAVARQRVDNRPVHEGGNSHGTKHSIIHAGDSRRTAEAADREKAAIRQDWSRRRARLSPQPHRRDVGCPYSQWERRELDKGYRQRRRLRRCRWHG